jgi:hypothetical protein
MAEFYSKTQFIDNELVPKEETIKFLIDYSKALSVSRYKTMEFDTLLN